MCLRPSLRASPRPACARCFSLSFSFPISTQQKPKLVSRGPGFWDFLKDGSWHGVVLCGVFKGPCCLQATESLALSQNGAWQQAGAGCFSSLRSSWPASLGAVGTPPTHPYRPGVAARDGPGSMPGAFSCIFSFHPYNSTLKDGCHYCPPCTEKIEAQTDGAAGPRHCS